MIKSIGRRLATGLALAALVALALPLAGLAGDGNDQGDSGSTSLSTLLGSFGSTQTASCGYPTDDVFAAFGDPAPYYLVPGGDLEAKKHGWKLSGPAAVVSSPSLLGPGQKALSLGQGGQGTTQKFCLTADAPTTRFVVDVPADPAARLRVDVLAPCSTGTCSMPIGWVYGGNPGLRPSAPMSLLANLGALFSVDGLTTAQLRFTAETGTWKVDDVYVDPFRRV